MPLEFHNDAICLSGVLGTKLKSQIIHKYYKLWWQITSGGPRLNYYYPTSIIEMNAATGEIYIEESGETVLGSACCALDLKFKNEFIKDPDIYVILVEGNDECTKHLKNVINHRYPGVNIKQDIDSIDELEKDCILLRKNVNEAIELINKLEIKGRSIYFFDPLLSVDMGPLREVYEKRIINPFNFGVEFIIFFFTSDWIFGRNDFRPLPLSPNSKDWTVEEKDTVQSLNNVYGDNDWYNSILTVENPAKRMENLIQEYKERLFTLFRFVVPMPFIPKGKQLYHLIFCSNFKAGASIISGFYEKLTNNRWTPDNRTIYNKFHQIHRSDIKFPKGSKRPVEWKLLWNFIKNYNNGKFDILCRDVREIESNPLTLKKSFGWLENQDYIKKFSKRRYKGKEIKRYQLNWQKVHKKLGLEEPPAFEPLRDKDIK